MDADGSAHSDTATGATCLAARPAPGSKLGPSEASLSAAVLERLGLAEGEAVALRSGEHAAWAVVRDHGHHDDRLVRLGRMLWPQLGVRPGETVAVEAAGELPEAGTARITPPYNLTFNLHQRLLERLRDDRTPLYPGNRVVAEIYPGGAAMLVRIDLASPSPSRMGDATEVEVHRADASVSERLITLADVGGCDAMIRRLRELVELPLLRPAFYRRLGVRPPKGVLLHGPPGTGKTLICKALVRCPQTFARVSFLWCFMLLVGVVGPSGGLSRLGFGRVRGVARRAGRGLGRWRCASAGRRAADGSTLCGWGAGSC